MAVDLTDPVGDDDARDDLIAYFNEDGERRYTGRRFDSFAGGGDLPGVQDVFTPEDLLAVQALSVVVPSETVFDLLGGPLGRELTALLARVPVDVELGTRDARKLVQGPVLEAWQLLKEQKRIGYVTAGKLIARKRPHLIPVYDEVIRCQFGGPQQVWIRLHDRLREDDGQLRGMLAALRTRAQISPRISLLRVLDVVLWMRHHAEHLDKDCPGFGTVSLDRLWPESEEE
ncbi:DUF6308 family protein [Actinoplanes sp. L3-i22]|uniref:DUF6308 family protein n=1 Tax=Actinoplanes sp. L3-i22 TaxID=2836373 RepID=UPI001C77750D|nr:DUF6308 family protein [Actinoplanes sp. L3-i22]BCY07128.1 hypothetical protein L3i22_022160 [Actinoplanes sp. L3-i22]